MNPQYPCKIWKNEVQDKDPSICCDICNIWSHIECVNISPKILSPGKRSFICLVLPICVRSLPFSDLRTKELRLILSSDTLEHTQKSQTVPKKTE